VLEQRQTVKHCVHRLAQLAEIIQRSIQVLACLVQITLRGELSCEQQARPWIEAQIRSGALELDGAFDCRALDASTEPELDARERGQALCEQGIVTCSFGKLQGTARVILGRGRAGGELRDVGDVCVECGSKRGIVLGVIEGFAKTLQRSIEMDRVLQHAAEA
jgi:hypothetical protein